MFAIPVDSPQEENPPPCSLEPLLYPPEPLLYPPETAPCPPHAPDERPQ